MREIRPMKAAGDSPADRRLIRYVAFGFLGSAAFVVFDLYSESMIGAGTMSGRHAGVHFVVDHLLPLVIGPLLGVAAHYVRLRSRLTRAEESAARAEALRTRLQKVERDQAFWVLAATVLHELNNPLHALRLLLDEMVAEDDAAGRADLLARARSQTDRLLARLKALRSMRSMSEPQATSVALDEFVSAITQDAQALAAEDGLSVRLLSEGGVKATADTAYLRTIVENLLDNSLHALRLEGMGSVTVQVGTESERAVVRISDDGADLSASARESLFEPLASTKQNGLGLGLPIARALARAMGGDLIVEETDKKTFRLELPMARPA
jgi:two-component system, LuxR family, sensor kinase FixL